MSRRSQDWDEGLARDLQNKDFAQEFILSSIDEGLSIQAILAKVIKSYGLREFSKKVRMASPNVLRAIDPRHNPTQDTLNRLLQPFGLCLSISLIEERARKAGKSAS